MISYVDSWELREKKDVHPSHRTAVIEVEEILEMIHILKKVEQRHRPCELRDNKEYCGYCDGINMFIKNLEKEIRSGK